MDQIKTGEFIAALRREKNMSQRELADVLMISDKTVSKWETGRGLPDVSLMMPLCDALDITVNELLSGERLSEASYKAKAEENIMNLIEEKKESKKKIALSVAVCVITIAAGTALVSTAGLFEMQTWQRILYIVLGLVVIAGGIAVAVVLDVGAGTYECRKCGARFVPTTAAYVNGMHTIRMRRLKCPKCGEKSWCIRRLTH
ncbi:MAG: helix-turn-helix transcriptional regulator [Clostridia bacterium]|nr:helix-turn-helix transcriptional regulator [Clostridia bacterium]